MVSYKTAIFSSKNKQMTLKQIEQSVATFRKSCMEQTGVNPNSIDAVRRGEFPENDTNLKVPSYSETYFTLKWNFLTQTRIENCIRLQFTSSVSHYA